MIRRGTASPAFVDERMMRMIERRSGNGNGGMANGPDTLRWPARNQSSRRASMIHRRELLWRAHLNEADRALLGVRKAVGHEGVKSFPALLRVENGFEHRTAARRHGIRLDVAQHVRGITIRVDPIEDRA